MLKKFLALPVLGAALLGGAGSMAATAVPAAAQYVPAIYFGVRQPAIRGVVTYFYRFNMTLQMPNGAIVQVRLHQGTIINPVGGALALGMPVVVHGYWANGTFFANRIRVI